MESALSCALAPELPPVAILFADSAPPGAFAIPRGKWGCVMWLLSSAAKGRAAVATRASFGCFGGGTGLGFGNQYLHWPGGIECFYRFLSAGDERREPDRDAIGGGAGQLSSRVRERAAERERYLGSPELARRFVEALPIVEVPASHVVFKPLGDVAGGERPEVVVFLVDPDRLAALSILAGFGREPGENVTLPQAAGCQTVGILPFAERDAPRPRAVVGPSDISARLALNRQLGRRDLMTFAVPWRLYEEMEANVGESILAGSRWRDLLAAGSRRA